MEEARSPVLSTTELAVIPASEADVGTNPSTTLLAAAGTSVARGISVVTPSIMLLTNSEGWKKSLGRASLMMLLAAVGRSVTPLKMLEGAAGKSDTTGEATSPVLSTREVAAAPASEATDGTFPSRVLLAAAGRSVVTPSIMLLTNSVGWERSLGRASLIAAAGTLGMPSTVLEVAAGRSEFATLETIPEISSARALVGES
jgi:hypothetical protein